MSSVLTISWWMMPLSGATEHQLPDWLLWHARCMTAAWGVLLPVGALTARYFKITPRQKWPAQVDNRAWWHAHRLSQYLGMALVTLGIYLTWDRSYTVGTVAQWHTTLGWVVSLAGFAQLLSAWLRGSKGGPTEPQMRGDHYDMTRHRLLFECFHKSVGWLCVFAAVATLVLGLVAADAPRWMLGTLGAWWLALSTLAFHWQKRGRCVDTYQAIWGPGLQHPGNHLKPIGWGVHRPKSKVTS